MNGKILLVATVDEAYHQLLLESQGYSVQKARMDEALGLVGGEAYDLMLVTPEGEMVSVLEFCEQAHKKCAEMKIVLIARRAEYVPSTGAVHAVIREQSTPGRLLATIKKTIEGAAEKGMAVPIPEEEEDR